MYSDELPVFVLLLVMSLFYHHPLELFAFRIAQNFENNSSTPLQTLRYVKFQLRDDPRLRKKGRGQHQIKMR